MCSLSIRKLLHLSTILFFRKSVTLIFLTKYKTGKYLCLKELSNLRQKITVVIIVVCKELLYFLLQIV